MLFILFLFSGVPLPHSAIKLPEYLFSNDYRPVEFSLLEAVLTRE